MMDQEKFIQRMVKLKTWLKGIGLFGIGIGIGIWWIVKIIICLTTGVCIP